MSQLAVFLLVCWGVTAWVTLSSMLAGGRQWVAQRSAWLGEALACPQCAGFWVGLGVALVLPLGVAERWIEVPIQGFISSGFCLLLHSQMRGD